MSTVAEEIVATSRTVCRTCQNTRRVADVGDGLPGHCPTCKPYGARIPATSVHPAGARVYNGLNGRTGTVLRAWKQTQGATRPSRYTYCDVLYDDGLLATAWEFDLELVRG